MSSEKPAAPANEMLRMTAEVAAAYVGHNTLPATQITDLIKTIYGALQALESPNGAAPADLKPVVPIKKSVTPDFIICLEDGKKLKMLKRHLRTAYGLTPEEYRAKWGLPPDYPMVAPNYAEQRSIFARKIGLGHKTTAKKKK
jgi:predicted transcriptional regulator